MQKQVSLITNKLTFIFSHLSLWGKMAIFSLCVCFISLVSPWFQVWNNTSSISTNSFSSILWGIWFFLSALLLFNMFQILSLKKKKFIQNMTGIFFSKASITFLTSLIVFFSSIHIHILIKWLNYFNVDILYSTGIVLCITSSFLLFFSSFILKKEENKSMSWSYIWDISPHNNVPQADVTENNMKLPI